MAEIKVWPYCLLTPRKPRADPSPFTRSGGASLGGVEPATRTDRGWWTVDYGDILLTNTSRAKWRTWGAIRQHLSGRSGLIAVRIPASLSAPYASGKHEPVTYTTRSDGTTFDDGTRHAQGAINVVTDGVTPIGATTIRLRIINAAADLVGVRFSFNHAAYETGPVISVDGDVWEVPVTPAVRQTIPAGSDLEFDNPTVVCRLASDRGMDLPQDAIGKTALASVSFIEATDYWSRLALGLE
ncbi:MAG: hypothetical protein H5U22_01735 [Rhizobium sp.]|nr:hypothetical protein [Rhizobium sp.]